ncbi:MAG: hypothetical protein GEV04_10210 [Actinophytocola sp.]|nr:hypothetical protein [Actinophytocola sp.]
MLAKTMATLTGDELAELHTETEGNPLFLVESLRAGWPANREPSAKVHAVIESRLRRLSPAARDLAGLAATIGREFGVDVVTVASGQTADDVLTGLDELWRRRIVREHGADGYDFTHDKIRDVAYRAVTPPVRRRHHRRVADALATDGVPDAVSGQVAHHYQRAGDVAASVPWTLRAAEAAARLHADRDAVRLLQRALALLRAMPSSVEHNALELRLLTALPGPLCAVEGYSSPGLVTAHSRALELARALDVELEPPMVRSLALSSLSRSDFDGANRFGTQLLWRGEREHDDVLVVEGTYVLGIAAFWRAEFAEARRYFERAIEHYEPEQRSVHLIRYGQDPRVVCTSRLANTLWFLGEQDAALRTRDAALALAEETGHPFSRSVVLVFAALLALDMADDARMRGYVTELTAMDGGAAQNRVAIEAMRCYLDVLESKPGVARCRALLDKQDAASAPGLLDILRRVLLAAATVAGDEDAAASAADALVARAPNPWQSLARRARDGLAARNP